MLPYYDGKYGAPEANEEDPQSHNPLWDMAQTEVSDTKTQERNTAKAPNGFRLLFQKPEMLL